MWYKLTAADPATETDLEGLMALVRLGKTPPTTLVKHEILTDDQWWTIDNLRQFHANSPTQYTPGPHLTPQRIDGKAVRTFEYSYEGTETDLRLGDIVEVRRWFRWRRGRVTYLHDPGKPSIPKGPNPHGFAVEIEVAGKRHCYYSGMVWRGLRFISRGPA